MVTDNPLIKSYQSNTSSTKDFVEIAWAGVELGRSWLGAGWELAVGWRGAGGELAKHWAELTGSRLAGSWLGAN